MIGIIGAMDVEINLITDKMINKTAETISGVTYTTGEINKKKVVAAVCGIGKVFAAMCAQTMVVEFKAEVIINTGIAGTLTQELNILDTVVAQGAVQHDMNTEYFGDPRGLLSGINIIELPCDRALAEKICANIKTKYIRGIIASGDIFISDEKKKKKIADEFHAVCCEMEGAAIAQVCYMNNIPCAIVRTISDGADGGLDYETFRSIAAQRAADIIIETIKNL